MSDPKFITPGEDEIRWARETPPAIKLIDGARLFDYACAVTMAGIRKQHPAASQDQILAILRERLKWASQWE